MSQQFPGYRLSVPLSKTAGFNVWFGPQAPNAGGGYMKVDGQPTMFLSSKIAGDIFQARERGHVSRRIAESTYDFIHELAHHFDPSAAYSDNEPMNKEKELAANRFAAKNFVRMAKRLGLKPAIAQKLWKSLPDHYRDPQDVDLP